MVSDKSEASQRIPAFSKKSAKASAMTLEHPANYTVMFTLWNQKKPDISDSKWLG